MTISDILQHPVLPFEIEDVKLVKLFSFFLHSAPTIESATAISMETARLEQNWMSFITFFPKKSWLVIAPNCTFGEYLIKANLDGNAVLSRRMKGFVCKRKTKDETDCEACLRHIRNAIAHNNVFVLNAGNRKFILFDDYNKDKKHNARLLFTQSDLQRLKSEITK